QKEIGDQPGTPTAIGTAYANLLKATEDMSLVPAAEKEFKQALKMEPLHLPTMRNYAALLDLVKRDAEAEAQLKRVLELVPSIDEPEAAKKRFLGETHYELGWLLFRDPSGTRLAEAAAHFQTSLENEPNNPAAWQYRGMSLLGLNQMPEATAALTKFC